MNFFERLTLRFVGKYLVIGFIVLLGSAASSWDHWGKFLLIPLIIIFSLILIGLVYRAIMNFKEKRNDQKLINVINRQHEDETEN